MAGQVDKLTLINSIKNQLSQNKKIGEYPFSNFRNEQINKTLNDLEYLNFIKISDEKIIINSSNRNILGIYYTLLYQSKEENNTRLFTWIDLTNKYSVHKYWLLEKDRFRSHLEDLVKNGFLNHHEANGLDQYLLIKNHYSQTSVSI